MTIQAASSMPTENSLARVPTERATGRLDIWVRMWPAASAINTWRRRFVASRTERDAGSLTTHLPWANGVEPYVRGYIWSPPGNNISQPLPSLPSFSCPDTGIQTPNPRPCPAHPEPRRRVERMQTSAPHLLYLWHASLSYEKRSMKKRLPSTSSTRKSKARAKKHEFSPTVAKANFAPHSLGVVCSSVPEPVKCTKF